MMQYDIVLKNRTSPVAYLTGKYDKTGAVVIGQIKANSALDAITKWEHYNEEERDDER